MDELGGKSIVAEVLIFYARHGRFNRRRHAGAKGSLHTVVVAGGTVHSVGNNGYGELTNNDTTNRSTFVGATPF